MAGLSLKLHLEQAHKQDGTLGSGVKCSMTHVKVKL